MIARFVSFAEAAEHIRCKTVAIVGSGPGCAENAPGFVDGHDIVCRVNNHKTSAAAGYRTDVHYSFYGNSIKKTPTELRREGVRLVMCKCPNGKPLQSAWHEQNGKLNGIDFRYIYALRRSWWFCDTFIPDAARFLRKMALLRNHIPTTGFSAILDVLDCEPASITLTGFDFFSSGLHNVNERWRPGDPTDPIGHRPELEAAWIAANAQRFTFDARLARMLAGREVAA